MYCHLPKVSTQTSGGKEASYFSILDRLQAGSSHCPTKIQNLQFRILASQNLQVSQNVELRILGLQKLEVSENLEFMIFVYQNPEVSQNLEFRIFALQNIKSAKILTSGLLLTKIFK